MPEQPTARRRRANGEQSRTRILDAAAEIAGERGYEGTSISLVSSRCGLPASSIYWHFKDKDDLIAAVMGMGADSMTPEAPALHTMPVLGQQNAEDTTAQQKLDALAEAERVRAGRGRAANMLTSPDDAPAPKVKKYLGGY